MFTANTCVATTEAYHTLAYYTHLIPALIAIFLSVFILIRSRWSFRARVFALFNLLFSIWLIGDLVAWTSPSYFRVPFVWSFLDYINVAFLVASVYFFLSLILERDIKPLPRIFLFLLTTPAFFITLAGRAILDFNIPVCEALENSFLTNYKLFVELLGLAIIVAAGAIQYQKSDSTKRRQIIVFGGSMFLFISIFSFTEYISSITDVYEINLYSLLILPVFLFVITFSITNLHIFKVKYIETQLLVYVLIIMTGSQLLFIQNVLDTSLSLITLLISIVLGVVLLRNVSIQSKQRKQIEELAEKLEISNKKLDQQNKLKTEFLSLASHQLRSPLTAIKGYASMLLDGSYGGQLPAEQEMPLKRIFESTNHLVNVVADLLNVSKIEQGGLVYSMGLFDFKKAVTDIVHDLAITAQDKGLTLSYKDDGTEPYMMIGDVEKLRQTILNVIDNAIKYTPHGSIDVFLTKDLSARTLLLRIKDTGVGMSPETKEKLFQKFARGEGKALDTGGSGLGLYLAKQIATAHKGDLTADSEGAGKGSTFTITLPIGTSV